MKKNEEHIHEYEMTPQIGETCKHCWLMKSTIESLQKQKAVKSKAVKHTLQEEKKEDWWEDELSILITAYLSSDMTLKEYKERVIILIKSLLQKQKEELIKMK